MSEIQQRITITNRLSQWLYRIAGDVFLRHGPAHPGLGRHGGHEHQ
jgi:hypothetical protein